MRRCFTSLARTRVSNTVSRLTRDSQGPQRPSFSSTGNIRILSRVVAKWYTSRRRRTGVNQINVADTAAQLAEDGEMETELMREVSFSFQVMRFVPGKEDPMHAHAEEEIYLINEGEATLVTEDESVEVAAGDVVHLGSGTDHQFVDIDDELIVTVVYAPAEGSQAV